MKSEEYNGKEYNETFLNFFSYFSSEDSFLDEQKAVEDIINDFRCNRFNKISNKLIITKD